MDPEIQNPFQNYPEDYERWYEQNRPAYISELECIRKVLPSSGRGLEVGVGTGRFAGPLKVRWGIDLAQEMLLRARRRGVKVIRAEGEKLPFGAAVFNYLLLVFTICFIKDAQKVLREARRVLSGKGRVIIGFVDRESVLGKMYQEKKHKSKFYSSARFYSVPEVLALLPKSDWGGISVSQTLIQYPLKEVQVPREGYGKGGFVVISAGKTE